MNLDEYESKVPQHILDRIGALLGEEGFKQSRPALFVKNLDTDWRAWLAIPGYPFALLPVIGIYDETLVQTAHEAWANLGRPSRQPPDSGPPLIMASLERIIGDDSDCKGRITWDFEVQDRHISDPTLIPALTPAVADDLVYCLRKKAYPFFSDHMSFQSIWDAARHGMGSPALPNYFPLILMKVGRRSDVMRYVDERLRDVKDEKFAADYRAYVQELLKLVPA